MGRLFCPANFQGQFGMHGLLRFLFPIIMSLRCKEKRPAIGGRWPVE
jgi:hypothetical protein